MKKWCWRGSELATLTEKQRKGMIEMYEEDSTKLEKSTLRNAVEWAGIVLLVALAVGINGGANFYGGYILATEMGLSETVGHVVGAALAIVTLFLLGAYLTNKRGLPVIYLHVFSGCLLMFDVMHFAGMSVNAVSAASGDIAQIDREIAVVEFQIQTAEKELSGLAVAATGNNTQALTSKINSLKNTSVSGGALWAVSAGCTVGGYRTKCSQIANLQGELDAEIAAISGAEVTKKRGEITRLMGLVTEKQGLKQGLSKKSDSSGFIAKLKPESIKENEFLLLLSLPFAVSFELFSVLAFGMLRGKVSPKTGDFGVSAGFEENPKAGVSVQALIQTLIREYVGRKRMEAVERGRSEGKAKAELEAKAKEETQEKRFASNNLESFLKNIDSKELQRFMMKKGVLSASEELEKRLFATVSNALGMYAEGEALATSGNNAFFEKIGDKVKHCKTRTIPALITMGFVSKDEKGTARWNGKAECWAALGLVEMQIERHATEVIPVRATPKLSVVK